MSPFLSTADDHTSPPDRARRRAYRRETRWSLVAIAITLVAVAGCAVETGLLLADRGSRGMWEEAAQALAGRGAIAFLLLSALAYQVARLGYLTRFATHRPAPSHALARAFAGEAPALTILVPSYMEEPPVIRRTLMAAALQQSPRRRVVLLIDDPPEPHDAAAAARLEAARALPGTIDRLFDGPRRRCAQVHAGFLARRAAGAVEAGEEAARLAALWDDAASFLEGLAAGTEARDHYGALFAERILRAPARAHRLRARSLRAGPPPAAEDLPAEYRRVAALFECEMTCFERRRWANLSHAPNKAMNLNSYIGLMGRGLRERPSREGPLLVDAGDEEATLVVPAADFVLVLDADSLIAPEYSLRLVHLMTRPGRERVAVVQTPYASVPGAPAAIERLAGATTDVQLMTHQGTTLFGAGSWVGASALIRRAALEEIAVTQDEGGHAIRVFIRDRTLTEDTDTTVALARAGWHVYNYPARLAWSATPGDFGALLIQRRRWATGGLIILGDVWRHVLRRPTRARLVEGLFRTQYILAAPLGSIACVALLVAPFAPEASWSAWAVPAFLAWVVIYARDLRHSGYRMADLPRALVLNVMLLPVNLAGAARSIGQLCTGRKIPFQRTPKVHHRTAAPPQHIAAQVLLLAVSGVGALLAFGTAEWSVFVLRAAYAAAFAYALAVYIGRDAAIEDLGRGMGERPRAWLEAARARPVVLSRRP